MAEVLSCSNLFSPSGTRCAAVSPRRRSPYSVAVLRRPWPERPGFGSLMSSSPTRDIFFEERLVFGDFKDLRGMPRKATADGLQVKKSNLRLGKGLRWWEKGVQPNMKEIQSADDLVESILDGGNRLVVVDFFSPGCGGCRALHPKICQIAEMNPNVDFLQVNYEEQKSMCYSLSVHVLPFFRFYRGAQGRLCSFSCTVATIKKFKDAMAKHTTERCSLGPARGLEESELLALAGNKDLSFSYAKTPLLVPSPDDLAEPSYPKLTPVPASRSSKDSGDKALVNTA